jgi:hypothetical protein
MGPGEDLDSLDQLAVPGDLAVVVAIGPHQVGQNLGVTGIGLRSGCGVAIPIAGTGHWVNRIDQIARTQQRRHHQAAVDFDTDRYLLGLLRVCPDELMELGQAFDAVGNSTFAEHLSGFVHHTDVMMVFSPVHTYKNHALSSSLVALLASPEEFSGDLMNQCSRHDTPTAVSLLTDQSGHVLGIGLKARDQVVLPIGGSEISLTQWLIRCH